MLRITTRSTQLLTSAAAVFMVAACGDRSEAPSGPSGSRTPTSAYFVAPSGSKTATGSKDQPWDLTTALAGGYPAGTVQAGDTLWLIGGNGAGGGYPLAH